jgi:hypothetical protein
MSDDIVKRLRHPNLFAEPAETQRRELVMAFAADEIELLRTENERLRKFSLKAFTVVESIVGEGHLLMYPAYDSDDVFMEGCDLLGVDDAETARAALEEKK